MKHGKNPTKAQKIFIKACRLNYENWLVVKDNAQAFEIVHRISGKTRKLIKN